MTDETFPFAPDAPVVETETAAPAPGPRIRWAAIVWGLVFAALAWGILALVTDAGRRDQLESWWSTLTPAGFALTVVLVFGGLLLLAGLAGLLRRATRGR